MFGSHFGVVSQRLFYGGVFFIADSKKGFGERNDLLTDTHHLETGNNNMEEEVEVGEENYTNLPSPKNEYLQRDYKD